VGLEVVWYFVRLRWRFFRLSPCFYATCWGTARMLTVFTEVSPRFSRVNRSKVCVLPMAFSLKAALSISCVSYGIFPSVNQNLIQMLCSFKSAIW
jgi:hypothetical protein